MGIVKALFGGKKPTLNGCQVHPSLRSFKTVLGCNQSQLLPASGHTAGLRVGENQGQTQKQEGTAFVVSWV